MRSNSSLPRKKRHKKIIKQAKGYFGSRSKHFRSAKEAVMHAKKNRTISRKLLKRDLRRLWISRINTFSRSNFSITYSKFISSLKTNKIDLNRKIISDMISTDEKKAVDYFKTVIY